MYKLNKFDKGVLQSKDSIEYRTFIPFDPANTDYANFKKEVLEGAELQDADGQPMSVADANAYVATLP